MTDTIEVHIEFARDAVRYIAAALDTGVASPRGLTLLTALQGSIREFEDTAAADLAATAHAAATQAPASPHEILSGDPPAQTET